MILFTVFSIIVMLDFALGGREAIVAAQDKATERTRSFSKGLGYLMLTVAAFQFLWLLVIYGAFNSELARHIATGIFCVVDIVAVIARRRWWRNATHV